MYQNANGNTEKMREGIDNKLCLLAQLNDKIHSEYSAYRDELYHMTLDEAVQNSYKTVMMNEFMCILENYTGDILEDEQIKILLKKKNLLELLYQDWLKFDSAENDIYKEFVFGYWNWDI